MPNYEGMHPALQLRQQVTQKLLHLRRAMAASDAHLSSRHLAVAVPRLESQHQLETTNTEKTKISYARQYNNCLKAVQCQSWRLTTNIAGMFGFRQAEFLQIA